MYPRLSPRFLASVFFHSTWQPFGNATPTMAGSKGKTLHIACMDGDIAAVQVQIASQVQQSTAAAVLVAYLRMRIQNPAFQSTDVVNALLESVL